MKNLASYIFPPSLSSLVAALLIVGAMQGQNSWVMLGAGLALIAGLVIRHASTWAHQPQEGMILGVVFAVLAVGLAYRNYRSVEEVIEFNERKLANDRLVIQGLKDMRTAQFGYKEANGGVHRATWRSCGIRAERDTSRWCKAIGQVPDTL